MDLTNESLLPDLPTIKEVSLEKLPEKTLPELPNYEKNIRMQIQDDRADFYEPEKMEKSSFKQEKEYPEETYKKDYRHENYSKEKSKKEKQIFVKLKRFEDAVDYFNEIKSKVDEILNDINKTKKIIEEEQNEIESWEKELTQIKDELDSVDKTLFSELDK